MSAVMHLESHSTCQAGASQRFLQSRETWPELTSIIRLVEESLGARNTVTVVSRIAAGLVPLIRELGPAIPRHLSEPSPLAYRRIELHHCPILGYQILAMIWGPGQGTPIHDHASTWGVESIWRGTLQVAEFDASDDNGSLLRLNPRSSTRLGLADVITLTPEDGLHLCQNPSRSETCISLHVYGTPLDQCNEYQPVGDGWYERFPVYLDFE